MCLYKIHLTVQFSLFLLSTSVNNLVRSVSFLNASASLCDLIVYASILEALSLFFELSHCSLPVSDSLTFLLFVYWVRNLETCPQENCEMNVVFEIPHLSPLPVSPSCSLAPSSSSRVFLVYFARCSKTELIKCYPK